MMQILLHRSCINSYSLVWLTFKVAQDHHRRRFDGCKWMDDVVIMRRAHIAPPRTISSSGNEKRRFKHLESLLKSSSASDEKVTQWDCAMVILFIYFCRSLALSSPSLTLTCRADWDEPAGDDVAANWFAESVSRGSKRCKTMRNVIKLSAC